MFEAYFDDSGTHRESEIAVAACYISTKRGWDDFVVAWDNARWEEKFDVFHMSAFLAPRDQKKEPFWRWDRTTKGHVYERLAGIINDNKRIGIACAVPKKPYDALPEEIKAHHGHQHYTFAVRTCMARIREWRSACGITLPMRYVFDWEMQGSDKRIEIENIVTKMHESWEKAYGFEPGRYGFEHKEEFKPLQAADILAWQMHNHMQKIMPLGHDDEALAHEGFKLLRVDQEMVLGFYTPDQLRAWVDKHEKFRAEHGRSIYEVVGEQARELFSKIR